MEKPRLSRLRNSPRENLAAPLYRHDPAFHRNASHFDATNFRSNAASLDRMNLN